MPVPGVRAIGFPAVEVTLTGMFDSAVAAESLTLKVSVVGAPSASELLPLIVTVVPVTSTLLVAVAESAVAVTVIVRLALFAPILSLVVTIPFASDTPLALMLLVNAVSGAGGVVNITVLPLTACFVALSTMAVRSTVTAPDEGICVLLASS